MAVEKQRTLELSVQKLTIELEQHIKQNDSNLQKIEAALASIIEKLDDIKDDLDTSKTTVAVLKTNFDNHLNNHEKSQRWFGVILTGITIVINFIGLAIGFFR